MKNSVLHRIVSVALAVYMVCISGGVDIYHYCCDACRSYGHDIYKTITCDEVHSLHLCNDAGCEHHHAGAVHNVDDFCSHLAQSVNHCDVHHFDAPQLAQNVLSDLMHSLTPIAVLSLFSELQIADAAPMACTSSYIVKTPPLSGGRAIIALKNSYII